MCLSSTNRLVVLQRPVHGAHMALASDLTFSSSTTVPSKEGLGMSSTMIGRCLQIGMMLPPMRRIEVLRLALEATKSFMFLAIVISALVRLFGFGAAPHSPALPGVEGEGQPADRRSQSEDGGGRLQGHDA